MATILVVEDDADIQELFVDLLTAAAYQVMTARNGLAALRILATWRPALLLIDIMMPVMSGLTLCQYLNTRPGLETIPRVMMSAAANKPLLDICAAHGFLDKPFDSQTLLALVHSLVVDRE
jgi:CheY-like chemotaxis protein